MSIARDVAARLVGAVQFLTLLPAPGAGAEPGRAAVFFPLAAGVIGAAGAGIALLVAPLFGESLAALAALAFWVGVTGALHEDGLADAADALRAGRTRERMLAILKDSRTGAYGVVAVVFSLVVRWQALASALAILPPGRVLAVLVASQAIPRAAMVALAWISRPVGDGLGSRFLAAMTTSTAVLAILQGLAAAAWCGERMAISFVLGAAGLTLLARRYFHARLGGVNGDCLGAASQVIEIFLLVMSACRKCSW